VLLTELHPEDVKAALKKRFRSVAAFERSQGLPEKSVNDVLRGRASARVAAAIESALNKPMTPNAESEFSDGSNEPSGAHRLNAEAR
jgi:lambda repressor-like predicted transcriptional regulator